MFLSAVPLGTSLPGLSSVRAVVVVTGDRPLVWKAWKCYVREMSGILLKISEMSQKNLYKEKLPKTVYCKLHICVHTSI